ncbi:MAG: hypothetical protein R2680_03585 [Nitrososphaeraceae archaeon]
MLKKNKKSELNDARSEILDILAKLPEKTYRKITEVEVEVGKIR